MRALILQFLGNEAHFASLINYQAYNENAPEGQAHHMFLRFMNPQIFLSQKCLCFVPTRKQFCIEITNASKLTFCYLFVHFSKSGKRKSS